MISKKKGSTLVTTIIIFGALFTVGIALLSMSLGDYKMRQEQNKRIKNLYGSESGLDVAYDIIVKDFDSAAQLGAFRAKQLEVEGANKNSPYKGGYVALQEELELLEKNKDISFEQKEKDRKRIHDVMEVLINKEFRRSFKSFLYAGGTKSEEEREAEIKDYSNPDVLIDSLKVKKSDDSTGYYLSYISGLNDKERDLKDDIKESTDFAWSTVDLVSKIGESEPQINVEIPTYPKIENDENYIESDNDEYNKNYEIRINSTFITTKGNTDINGQNKRTVQAIYNLKVPNYKDVVFGESQIQKHSIYEDKGLTIGGNMVVGDDNGGNVDITIDGNVFVEGTSEETSYDNKYVNGILLNNVKNANFKGNVVTRKTFNFGSNVKDTTINENLYAANVYAGGTDGNDSDKYKLTVGKDMVLNNDLTLNASNTNITAKNFYGINDKRIDSSTNNKSYKEEGYNKATNSSSIIVNKYKSEEGKNPSNITITDHALIMGVAYINTENGYATGESVGVKGNYNAYSEHVDSDNNKNTDTDTDKNLSFDANHDVDSPLYLVNGTVVDKNDHFFDYWKDKSGVDAGGVHFGNPNNVWSFGSIVYDQDGSQVKKGKGAVNMINTESLDKQKEYASRVYDMNMEEISGTLDDRLENLYKNPSGGKLVDKLMRFPNIEQTDKFLAKKAVQIGNKNGEVGIFNSNGDIVIKEATIDEIDISDLEGGTITISVPSNKTLNAFIATAGNVTIEGEVNIKGNIIAKGNLEIKGIGKKTITYNPGLATDLQMNDDYAEIFEQVFGVGDIKTENAGAKTEIVVQYDLSKFLKNLLWKLIK